MGTLLVFVSSAIAIVGLVRGEPGFFVLAVGLLAVIFANEVLGLVWQAPTTVLSRWWQRRPHAVERNRWLAAQREHQALVEPVVAAADFPSWKAFYNGDPRRRRSEVTLGEIADGEFYWRIIWFPTTEVVAWPFRWRDERWHRGLATLPSSNIRGPVTMSIPVVVGIGPAPLPEAIYLLGHAESADEGKRRIPSASTLDQIRTVLAGT